MLLSPSVPLSFPPSQAINILKGVLKLWVMKVPKYKEQCGCIYLHTHQEQCWWHPWGEVFFYLRSASLSPPCVDSSSSDFWLCPSPGTKCPSLGHSSTKYSQPQDTVLLISANHSKFCPWPIMPWIFGTDHLGTTICPSQMTSGHTLLTIRIWHPSPLGSLRVGNLHWVV